MSKDLKVDKFWVPEEWLPALGLTLAVEMDSHAAWGHLAASLGECSSVLPWRLRPKVRYEANLRTAQKVIFFLCTTHLLIFVNECQPASLFNPDKNTPEGLM